ncbi:hypothetical protein TrVE_jg10030 [Triparma verrucosa]|uniref:CRAL-TRIO domain-containing protein n=1 Tax=Triparma verrucosa TaxID=1606542 RepID=A0A9W7KXS1_9STRA|nr:hypothetical protein TrVE_jg10030 [Triparma verrucosa]
MANSSIRVLKAGVSLIGLPLVLDSIYQRRVEGLREYQLRVPILHKQTKTGQRAAVEPTLRHPLLLKKNIHFNVMKEYYPMYIAGRTRKGDMVYYEEMGRIDMPKLQLKGVTVASLLDHYEASTIFAFEVLQPEEGAQMLSVFDAEGCSFKELKGDAMKFMKTASSKMQANYADRNCGVMIINTPSWIARGWKALVKMRLFSKDTLEKTKVYSKEETFKGLLEKVAEEEIPVKYGGKLCFRGGIGGEDNCRRWSTDEVRLRKWVLKQPQNANQVPI